MAGPFSMAALSAKVGPLPAWEWALIAGGGLALLALVRRKGSTPQPNAGALMLNPALNFGGGGGGGAGGGGGGGTPPPTTTPPPPATVCTVWNPAHTRGWDPVGLHFCMGDQVVAAGPQFGRPGYGNPDAVQVWLNEATPAQVARAYEPLATPSGVIGTTGRLAPISHI